MAVQHDHAEVIQVLAEYGADINARDLVGIWNAKAF